MFDFKRSCVEIANGWEPCILFRTNGFAMSCIVTFQRKCSSCCKVKYQLNTRIEMLHIVKYFTLNVCEPKSKCHTPWFGAHYNIVESWRCCIYFKLSFLGVKLNYFYQNIQTIHERLKRKTNLKYRFKDLISWKLNPKREDHHSRRFVETKSAKKVTVWPSRSRISSIGYNFIDYDS